MLAAHDQENLVHGRQAAAATKPLNQSTRQLAPKTPGVKAPKTPFKVPLNDENANGGLGAGKATLKTKGDGKNAFVTPMGPKNRAPLGAKTTNAKARAFQTPVPSIGGDLAKTKKNSVSAQKPKLKPKPAETTKLEVLGDEEIDDVPEIEYMPPRSKNLPDIPDDHQELNLSMFSGNIFEGAGQYFANRRGLDGLTFLEREEKREEAKWAITERKMMAKLQRDADSIPLECYHNPECPGELCQDTVTARKEAQEEYERTIAIIDAEVAPKKPGKQLGKTAPSTAQSKAAATALSKPKSITRVKDPVKKPTAIAAKPRLTTAIATAKRTPAPTNPSSMRHNAAVAASRTTIGPAKGRAVSSSLRKEVTPKKAGGFVPFEERDTSVSGAQYWKRYGAPPLGSEMWIECWKLGFLKEGGEVKKDEQEEEERVQRDSFLEKTLRDEALEDFQLTLGE